MTDHLTRLGDGVGDLAVLPDDMLDDADLGLIADYLTGELPPERIAEVKWRLEQDEAFRNLAAPLVAAWSIAPRWQPHPMPRAELQRAWDDFTWRAGLVRRRRARPRWLRLVGLLFVLFVFWLVAPIMVYLGGGGGGGNANPMQFVPVADSGGWMSLGKVRVKLDSGAKLERARTETSVGYMDVVRLEGTANFVHLMDTSAAAEDPTPFSVMTDGASVIVTNANARISARKDTTDVEVLRRGQTHELSAAATQTDSVIAGLAEATHDLVGLATIEPLRFMPLRTGEIGRVIKGQTPVKLRTVADSSFDDNPIVRWLLGRSKKYEEKHDSLRAAHGANPTAKKDSSRRAP
jgi:hypothetical protein